MGRAFKLGGDPRPAAAVAQFYFFLFYQFLIVIMSARAIHDNGIESLNRPVLNCSTFAVHKMTASAKQKRQSAAIYSVSRPISAVRLTEQNALPVYALSWTSQSGMDPKGWLGGDVVERLHGDDAERA